MQLNSQYDIYVYPTTAMDIEYVDIVTGELG